MIGNGNVSQNQFYTLQVAGTLPVLKAEAKVYARIPSAVTADDDLIDSLLAAVTRWGEIYTSRSFRTQTWTLLQDSFEDRIQLRRSVLNKITSVKYLQDDSLSTVDGSTYYLKSGQHRSEILLFSGETWPTDGDVVEQALSIIFDTEAWSDTGLTDNAILRHFLHLYENRGDCDHHSPGDMRRLAKLSGATDLYDSIKIARV